MAPNDQLERRRRVGLAAIRSAYGTIDDECGATLFVSHHLAHLEPAYWEERLQTTSPTPDQILALLVVLAEEEDGDFDTLDFTLPDDATNYVLSVSFSDDDEVECIEMES